MKALQIVGYHNSGKTTVVKELVKRLKSCEQSVATIKEIHRKDFKLDDINTNSYVHKKAGADLVIICAERETDFLYSKKLDFLQSINNVNAYWLIVEGFSH